MLFVQAIQDTDTAQIHRRRAVDILAALGAPIELA
jgi:hypothetical protein